MKIPASSSLLWINSLLGGGGNLWISRVLISHSFISNLGKFNLIPSALIMLLNVFYLSLNVYIHIPIYNYRSQRFCVPSWFFKKSFCYFIMILIYVIGKTFIYLYKRKSKLAKKKKNLWRISMWQRVSCNCDDLLSSFWRRLRDIVAKDHEWNKPYWLYMRQNSLNLLKLYYYRYLLRIFLAYFLCARLT